jgi:tRNA pseudouridine-54 N-methylase
MIRRVSLQPDEDIIKIANKKAMQAVCEAAEKIDQLRVKMKGPGFWVGDKLMDNLKAALEKWRKVKEG